MGIEAATYISDLDANNPVGSTDAVSTLDNHDRLIKSVLKATFPNANAAMNMTPTEANLLVGLTGFSGTGAVLAKTAGPTFTGTVLVAALTASGVITGDGSGLTTLSASALASGTIPDARFPATLPAVSGANLTNLDMGNAGAGTLAIARGGTGQTTQTGITRQNTLAWTIASDPGTTPSGSPGDVFAYY